MANARQIIYLSDVFDGISYYAGGTANNVVLMNALTNPDDESKSMSHVTLDIRDVIITPSVEKTLYEWMRLYDLDVIDTTIEGVKQRYNPNLEVKNPDGSITKGGFETYIDETPIKFRNDALMQMKEKIRLSKSAIDITDFMYYNEEKDKLVFDQEHSARRLAQKINEYIQSGNRKHRFLISFGNLSHYDENLESIRQIAAFLITANAHVAVPYRELHREVSRFGILPMISQLCFNFETKSTAWNDIKKKFPVGSELYFSTNPTSYIKGKVVKNVTHRTDDGTYLGDITNLTEQEREDFYSIIVEFKNNEGKLTEFKIQSVLVGNRQVLIFPTSIFEGTVTATGHPTAEELRANIRRSQFQPRMEVVITDNDLMYLNAGRDLTKETDWISLCRTQEEKEYRKLGLEPPKVDLLKIIRGGQAPKLINFRKRYQSANKVN